MTRSTDVRCAYIRAWERAQHQIDLIFLLLSRFPCRWHALITGSLGWESQLKKKIKRESIQNDNSQHSDELFTHWSRLPIGYSKDTLRPTDICYSYIVLRTNSIELIHCHVFFRRRQLPPPGVGGWLFPAKIYTSSICDGRLNMLDRPLQRPLHVELWNVEN